MEAGECRSKRAICPTSDGGVITDNVIAGVDSLGTRIEGWLTSRPKGTRYERREDKETIPTCFRKPPRIPHVTNVPARRARRYGSLSELKYKENNEVDKV